MPLPRVTFTFDGAAADQSRGLRHLPLGAFAELRNTREVKRGTLRKRRAFHRQAVTLTNQTTETVTNGTAFDSIGWAGGAVYRDNRDNFWALSSDRTAAYYRGNLPRLGSSLRAVGHNDNKTHKASAVLAGNDLWEFSLGTTSSDLTTLQSYGEITASVFDAATGIRKGGPTAVAGSARNYCAVYDGSRYIWLFTVDMGATIRSYKLDTLAAPSTSPPTAAFYSDVNALWNGVDAILLGGNIYVVATSYNSAAGKGAIAHYSRLNTATGTESVGSDAINYSPPNQAVTAQITSGPSFLQDQPGGTYGYFACWTIGTTDARTALKLFTFDLATLVSFLATPTVYEVTQSELGITYAGVVSGFYDGSDTSAILLSQVLLPRNNGGNEDRLDAKALRRDVFSIGAVTTVGQTYAQGACLASKPFKDTASGRWYVLTQYDDTEDVAIQRSWQVRRADRAGPLCRNIVLQEAWGRGAAAYHMWQSDTADTVFSDSLVTHATAFCPAVGMLGGKFYAGIELADGAFKTAAQVLVLDTAAAWSPPTRLSGNLLAFPGGVPQVVGPQDMARDLAPLMGPTANPTITFVGSGSDLEPCLVTYGYRYRTVDGRITRSPILPEPVSLTWTDAGSRTIKLQTLRHIGRDGLGAEIELWATIPGGAELCLQAVFPNDPTAATVTMSITPEAWTELGEPLPTSLVATPPPPARVVATFKDRLFLSGTDLDGELWFSQPFEEGLGIELNAEGLRQVLTGGVVNAMAPIDWNSFAIFRRDGITVIQGTGPSGDGGAYETIEVHTAYGVERTATTGHIVVPSSRGIFFQGADSRIQFLTAGLMVIEVGQGIENVALAAILTAGLEVINDGSIWLQFADGSTCALDFRDPTQSAPFGEVGAWHTWTSAALTAASAYSIGLVDANGLPIWLEADGYVRRPKTGSDSNQWLDDGASTAEVLTRWKTGKVAPAGMHVEIYVSDVQLLGTHVAVSSCRLTIVNDADSPETHDVTSSSPVNYITRPGNCLRTQELEVYFEELSSSTEGPAFDGFAVEFRPQDQKRLATGRIF